MLDQHLAVFRAKCDWALQLFYDTVSLYNENKAAGFTADMKYMIIENIILQLWCSWEKFLEDIFIAYMLGDQSVRGSAVKVYVSPVDEQHAYRLIKNIMTYPEWAEISKIQINAENFFENSGPFILLPTLRADINGLRKIRNAIAHSSKKAQEDFENLVRGRVGHLPDHITPAKFVSEYKVGPRRSDPTFFQYYVEFLKGSAAMLVEYDPDSNI